MQIEPYWITPSNYKKFLNDRKLSNGYCINCNRPIHTSKIMYCMSCNRLLYLSGLERFRVRIGEVGKVCIPYQQNLHRKFFGYNAQVKYRGVKEERIKNNLNQDDINKMITKLNYALKSGVNDYLYKPYTLLEPNRQRRVLYNIFLYYIAYHIYNHNNFMSEAHFYASMCNQIRNTIVRESHKQGLEIYHRNHTKYLNTKKVRKLALSVDAIMSQYLPKIQ